MISNVLKLKKERQGASYNYEEKINYSVYCFVTRCIGYVWLYRFIHD